MKLRYIIPVLLLFLSACSDFLDKESDTELTLDMVFEDESELEGMLAYVYSGIPNPNLGYFKTTGWCVFGDDWTPSERYQQWSWDVIPKITGDWNTSSSWDGNYWKGLPKCIREANIIREYIEPIDDSDIDEQEVTYIKAECRFFQAYYYFLLANTYAAIPFQPDYIAETDGSTEDLLVGPTPYDSIISWCDEEMLACSEILPAVYTKSSKYGRATSIMCLAIRARMLLFAASPLVNGNSDYDNYTDNDGVAIFNTTYDESKWTKALNAHKLLIEEAEGNGYELYKLYNDDGTIDALASTQWVHCRSYEDGNSEVIFPETENTDYYSPDKLMSPYGANGNGGLGITQSLVDAFFMKNGLPAITGYEDGDKTEPVINEESGYTESGYSTEDDTRTSDNDWNWYDETEEVVAKTGTFNMYVNREPRFYNAVLWNERYYIWSDRNTDYYNGGKDNPSCSHDAPQNGYLGLKRKHPNSDSEESTWPYRAGIVYRLAEAYLSYCEILNEINPGNTDILYYLNLIRERAGIPQYSTTEQDGYIKVNLGDQDEMEDLIRRERRVELCGEGIRYDDLRRWKEAEETLDGDFYGMDFTATTQEDFFKRTQYQTRVYGKKCYWFPIYQDEIDKNPNLVQSPFWTEAE